MADELTDLIEALQSGFDKAQRSVDEQQSLKIRRQFELDQNGEPKSLSWAFYAAQDDEERAYELIKVPLYSFHSTNGINIKQLSVEFDCKLEKVKSDNGKQTKRIVLNPQKKAIGKEELKLKISLPGEKGAKSQISLNNPELNKELNIGTSDEGNEEETIPLQGIEVVFDKHRGRNKFKWILFTLLVLTALVVSGIVFFQYNPNNVDFIKGIEQFSYDWMNVLKSFSPIKQD